MNSEDLSVIRKMLAHDLMQVYVRLFLLLTVAWFSVEVFAPFLALALWSLILAVSLFPLNHWLAVRLHLSEGKAAVIFICIAFLIIGIPAGLLGASMAQHMGEWVMVLRGSARIRCTEPERIVDLSVGDHLHLPPHRRHRVERTDPDPGTLWLALHWRDSVSEESPV